MKKAFSIATYIFAAIGLVLVLVYIAVELGLTKTSGIIDQQHDYFKDQNIGQNFENSANPSWAQGEEWQTLKAAIEKDELQIKSAAEKAKISSRLIVSVLIVEQLRLFHSNRELFKEIFAPLKILGNQSQFSWGIMGIKQDTAKQIEKNLKNKTSPFYLGTEFENLLNFSASHSDSKSVDAERFARLTSEDDRSYSYLYAALALKQLESQWKKAGTDIANRPDILATLFNIGFENSKPHENPLSGGAEIEIGDTKYSFGSLARDFYESNEMIEMFAR